MQPLDLNLASRPFRNNTLLWVGYGTTVVLLTLFSVWSVQTYVEHSRLLAEVQDKVGDVETRTLELERRTSRAQNGIKKFNLLALQTQADKANEVIDWKAFSWTRLFNLMAEIQPYKIRMTSIRPIFRAARRGGDEFASEFKRKIVPVSIQGTAKDFAAVAELQNKLLANPQIGRVEPDRLFKAENGDYVFEMRFYYLPPESTADAELETAEKAADAAEAPEPGEAQVADAEGAPVAAGEEEVVRRPVVTAPSSAQQPLAAAAEPAGATAEPPPTDGAGPSVGTTDNEAADGDATRQAAGKRPILRKTPGKPGRRPVRSKGQQ